MAELPQYHPTRTAPDSDLRRDGHHDPVVPAVRPGVHPDPGRPGELHQHRDVPGRRNRVRRVQRRTRRRDDRRAVRRRPGAHRRPAARPARKRDHVTRYHPSTDSATPEKQHTRDHRRPARVKRRRLRTTIDYTAMTLGTLLFSAPILYLIIGSLKPDDQVLNG